MLVLITSIKWIGNLAFHTSLNGNHVPSEYFPASFKQVLEKTPNVNLILSYLSYENHDPRMVSRFQFIPASNVVSITDSKYSCLHHTNQFASALQDFLVSAKRLRTLSFNWVLPFDPTRGRLPPIEHLVLPTMKWCYSAHYVERLWDFSLLQELQLPWFVLEGFLGSVRPELLSQLKCLRLIECRLAPSAWNIDSAAKYNNANQFTKLLEKLFISRHDYEVLDIRCLLDSFDMSIIAQQGRSLRTLKLLDLTDFEPEVIFPL
jgi:hypothetical protein